MIYDGQSMAENCNLGTVYWITGLPGAGKTSIANLFYHHRKNIQPTILLDGDLLREVLANHVGYLPSERLQLAIKYGKLCRMVAAQGIDVICATVSMYHQCRLWNRENIPQYREIYVRTPLEVLCQRDQKSLYSRAVKGEIANVIGVDLPFEEPQKPDIILENNGRLSLQELLDHLIQNLKG